MKKIDSSVFQGRRTEEFSEVVTIISKLNHTNIAEVVGYCSEQGHHLLIYEFFPNGSLHEFLHMSDDFSKPLTWNTRVRIALGTARALEYVLNFLLKIIHLIHLTNQIFSCCFLLLLLLLLFCFQVSSRSLLAIHNSHEYQVL